MEIFTQPDPNGGGFYLTRETLGVGMDFNKPTRSEFESGVGIMHTCPEPNSTRIH